MTMQLDWAVFGEKNRAHGLLETSISNDKLPSIEQLEVSSDQPSGNSEGLELRPFLSGFSHGDWYVLIRTLADKESGRGGMVRSFCLLLPLAEMSAWPDLDRLIHLLPDGASKRAQWSTWSNSLPKHINSDAPTELQPVQSVDLQWRHGLIQALLSKHHPGVWTAAQDSFETALAGLWTHLPPGLRVALRFGHSYAPNDLGPRVPHLVTTPSVFAARWLHGKIQPNVSESKATSEFLLLGLAGAEPLRQFLAQLPAIKRFEDLVKAEKCLEAIGMFERGEQHSALSAARLLGELAPSPTDATQIKAMLSIALVAMLENGDATTAFRYSNFSIDPFDDKMLLPEALRRWGDRNLDNSSTTPKFAKRIFDGSSESWWQKTLQECIRVKTSALTPTFARQLWAWLTGNDTLFGTLLANFPDQPDEQLYVSAPNHLETSTAKSLMNFVITFQSQRGVPLPRLTVFAGLKVGKRHSEIMSDCLVLDDASSLALETLATRIGSKDFVQTALKNRDARALNTAGQLCAQAPEILQSFDPASTHWQHVWRVSMQHKQTCVNSVPDGADAVVFLLKELQAGHDCDVELLEVLSQTPLADLSGHMARVQIWDQLSPKARLGFLQSTAQGVMARWRNAEIQTIEEPLARVLLEPACLSAALTGTRLQAIQVVVQLITLSMTYSPTESVAIALIQLIQRGQLEIPQNAAIRFANAIRNGPWVNAARVAFNGYQATGSATLSKITEHTLAILPSMERLWALIILKRPHSVDDFYAQLRETLCELFPSGPREGGFWDDVGGKQSDLIHHGTGHAQWQSALELVKRQKVRLSRLLEVARRRYPHHTDLEELERIAQNI
jgi:hypothetical protein